MTTPKITVIIPAYNHERYILEALKSVANQNYRPIEVIFIDDGSKDRTFEIGRDFIFDKFTDPVCMKRENKGAAYTINQALSMSSGDYINILNSDDFFSEDRLNRCVELAINQGSELIYSGVNFVGDDSSLAPRDNYIDSLQRVDHAANQLPTLGFAFLRNQLAISTGNLFFSKNLFGKVGYFNNYKYVHDWDYILRCMLFVEPVKIECNLYNYRFHGENSFKSLSHIAGYETTEIMRNYFWASISKYPFNPRAPCPHYWPGVFEKYIKEWNYHPYLPPRHQHPLERGRL